MSVGSSSVRRRYLSVRAGSYPPPVTPRPASQPLSHPASKSAAGMNADFPAKSASFGAPAQLDNAGPAWSLPSLESLTADAVPRQGNDRAVRGPSVLRTLIGAVAGGAIGAVVAILLLALSEPTERLPLLSRPVELWNSVDDVWVKVSAVVVAAGFVLLGAILARYQRSSS